MVSRETTDAIEEFAAQKLIFERIPAKSVVFAAATQFPDASGLCISFSMCCVASVIEANRDNVVEAPQRMSEDVYRAIAVLSADLFELSCSGFPEATGKNLLRHWIATQDKFFCAVS